jgi:low temperature requirement protein LtrA
MIQIKLFIQENHGKKCKSLKQNIMNTITIILFSLVLIPSIFLLWFIIIKEIIDFKKENLRQKLKQAAEKSDEALLDYVYNYFKL